MSHAIESSKIVTPSFLEIEKLGYYRVNLITILESKFFLKKKEKNFTNYRFIC